jgi:hypothetical protein
MASRRSLVDGLKETPLVDPQVEKQYVYNKPSSAVAPSAPAKPAKSPGAVGRSPVSTRLRTDLAEALKRASLQRQLEKVEPSSLTEILEAAIEPWLREHGYLD